MLCLDSALDSGINELDFWQMTIAEVNRAIKSKARVEKAEAQQHALFDYILADLIGKHVGRVVSSNVEIPAVEEVYSSLFVDENKKKQEEKQSKINELSALRFRQFANFHNNKYKGVSTSK